MSSSSCLFAFSLLIFFWFESEVGNAQGKLAAHPELIMYPHGTSSSIIPVVPLSFGRYYTEVRYNYDFRNTVAFYLGKSFSNNRQVRQSLIPQVGVLIGDFNGGAIQFYYRVESKRIELNFQNQYSVNAQSSSNRFYYNWSSIELKLTQHISVGGSTQLYYSSYNQDDNYNDNGVFVGVRKSRFYFFLFDFNAYNSGKHYLLTGLVCSIMR